ncbi:MAG: transposase [Methanobacteriaceae archaeon]|jgi:hypothetical protein|nr:transposase [Candidatus Methanorudis spinitermitis]
MKFSLYYDENDFKWILLVEILKVFDSREADQELAKNGISPLYRSRDVLKVIMIALFFDLDIFYTVSELNRDKKLKKQLMIDEVYSADQIYEFLSRFSEKLFYEFIIKLLNPLNFKNTRGIRNIIVDGTDIQIDLNWLGRRISKKSLEKKPYKWGYSSSKRYFIGLKLTLAIDCKTMQPIAMLLHEGTPNDAKLFDEIMNELKILFDEIMNELKIRRIIRKGNRLFFDKGYFSKDNYQIAIMKYKTSFLIFPQGKNPLKAIKNHLSYLLESFNGRTLDKEYYIALYKRAIEMLKKWKVIKA